MDGVLHADDVEGSLEEQVGSAEVGVGQAEQLAEGVVVGLVRERVVDVAADPRHDGLDRVVRDVQLDLADGPEVLVGVRLGEPVAHASDRGADELGEGRGAVHRRLLNDQRVVVRVVADADGVVPHDSGVFEFGGDDRGIDVPDAELGDRGALVAVLREDGDTKRSVHAATPTQLMCCARHGTGTKTRRSHTYVIT